MNKTINYKETVVRLYTYIKSYRIYFVGSLFFIAIGSVAVIAFHATLSPLFDMLVSDYSFQAFLHYIILLIGISLFVTFTHYLGLYLQGKLAENVVYKIRKDVFEHLQQLEMTYFDTTPHGEAMSILTNDIAALNIALEESISQVVNSIVSIIGTLIMMFIFSVPLTLTIIVMMVFILLFVNGIAHRSTQSFKDQQKQLGNMNAYIVEMLSGQKVIQVFHKEDQMKETFDEKNEKLRYASTKATILGTMIAPIVGSLSYVAYVVVAVLGGYFVVLGTMSIGNIASYLQFTRSFFNPVTQVSNQMNTVLSAVAGANRIFEFLDCEVEVDEGTVEVVNKDNETYWKENDNKLSYMLGDIQFYNVSFGYHKDNMVLKEINFHALPGQKIALIGSTGSGKTTISNLISRFYEINEGRVSIDGIDYTKIKKHDLRSTLSMVLQDIHLFQGTILENIRYGRLDATDSEVEEAALLAKADYFIRNLSKGYHTELSEGGENLSKGERQLIALARAAISNPRILVLDEATSSIDTRTEELVTQAMEELMLNRTTLIIAHRLSTIRNCDVILVLDHGEIIERGSHEELLKKRGYYYRLHHGIQELT